MTILFSSASMQWATPQSVYNSISDQFGPFDLDAAADAANTKCANFISEAQDSLITPWNGNKVWLNPPYGRQIRFFVNRAISELKREGGPNSVTMLVAARTDTRWFNNLISSGLCSEVVFVKGRIKFGDGTAPAPFASVVVHLKRGAKNIKTTYGVEY